MNQERCLGEENMKHKLSNLVINPSNFMLTHREVFFRGENACYDKAVCALRMTSETSFFTYFNACSLGKWKQYAGIQEVFLHIEFSGDPCVIQLLGMSDGDNEPVILSVGQRLVFNADSASNEGVEEGKPQHYSFDICFPETNKDVVGFVIDTKGETFLHEAFYYVNVEEEDVNPVKLALSTTTFKKEEYIVPNIELVKREVLACDDPIANNFHMFVIDNGQTLDYETISDEGVTVLPNKNVGGAGGFARGMMEAMSSDRGFTHVLLMDDDVKICTESLKRTFNLLSLAKGKYRKAFINGAMLSSEEPNLQFEDVAHVLKSGAYHRVKEDLHIDLISDLVKNESISVEVDRAYGAWWYSCIPVEAIRENGLPLPVFVRCDDVEFGMRNNPTYMTMNGICVWHEAFEGRFRPSVDGYQYVRNFLIMIAVDNCATDGLFMARLERNIRMYLRIMAYDTAELFLDGLEDYLKGPDYLAHVSGEKLMKENGARNEKLVPIEELGELGSSFTYNKKILTIDKRRPLFIRLWRTLPYDRHMLPDALLRDNPKPVFYSNLNSWAGYSMGTKTLVALDGEGRNGAVRHMDKERWRAIRNRFSNLKKQYKEQGEAVRNSYREALPELTSWEFWNDYLGTDLMPNNASEEK